MRVPAHHSYRRRKPSSTQAVLRYLPRLAAWLVLLYVLLGALAVRTVAVDSESMVPALQRGDRLVAAPLVYGTRLPWGLKRLPGIRAPRRGDIVLALSPQIASRTEAARILDAVLRFVTVQKVTLWPAETSAARLLLKRVVGLPGDRVRMTDYVAWILPAGGSTWVPESELGDEYRTVIEGNVPGSPPFGGSAPEVALGEGEYYLLGDNRVQSADSRTWGPVPMDRIRAAVVLRYFPLRRFGLP